MIYLIDNYDSFTYNLYQYIGEINQHITVKRNDEITLKQIRELAPSHIIISPGPGHPSQAGISVELIREFMGKIPILGICLGHQAIGLALGGTVNLARDIVHGKQSKVYHNGKGIFRGVPSPFQSVRYHSLAVMREGLPECLNIQAYTEDDTIMALEHKHYPVFGLQFHPESILSEYGKVLISNFLNINC
ncbi:MAG: aminodeoxychorismate/anthranilate synthase component II [Clostridia bacterium]|nr:aminodeoxychorismate/anthranilate synthase component II [Clostridia bacterium]